jgi:hypothetical protein
MRVESGRTWGRAGAERWALLAIPPSASRRAIALAVVELAASARPKGEDVSEDAAGHRPWALDVLLGAQP